MARGYSQRTNFKCHTCNKHAFTKQNMSMREGHLICPNCLKAYNEEQTKLYGERFYIVYRLNRGKIDRHASLRASSKEEATNIVLSWEKIKEIVSVSSEVEVEARWNMYLESQKEKGN